MKITHLDFTDKELSISIRAFGIYVIQNGVRMKIGRKSLQIMDDQGRPRTLVLKGTLWSSPWFVLDGREEIRPFAEISLIAYVFMGLLLGAGVAIGGLIGIILGILGGCIIRNVFLTGQSLLKKIGYSILVIACSIVLQALFLLLFFGGIRLITH